MLSLLTRTVVVAVAMFTRKTEKTNNFEKENKAKELFVIVIQRYLFIAGIFNTSFCDKKFFCVNPLLQSTFILIHTVAKIGNFDMQ